jgi:hypothetical protein
MADGDHALGRRHDVDVAQQGFDIVECHLGGEVDGCSVRERPSSMAGHCEVNPLNDLTHR